GQFVYQAQHGRAELVEAGVRQLHLRFDARGSHEPAPGRLGCEEVEQGRLANTGLATDNEHSASVGANVVDQRLHLPSLTLSATQLRVVPGIGHLRHLPRLRHDAVEDAQGYSLRSRLVMSHLLDRTGLGPPRPAWN